MNPRARKAPFPWFGGKSTIASEVWRRFGRAKQYIEPFCGSAAVLLAAPEPASLEVIGDQNCYVANFWRALKFRTDDLWAWQDYPVSHVDVYARHRWLTEPARVAELRDRLLDPEWPGDAKIAGWWLWGQCCWIGSGWCDPTRAETREWKQIPRADAGVGVQSATLGQIPFVGSGGMGTQCNGAQDMVRDWLAALAARLGRVRVIHGDWSRCLNHHYGGTDAAIFLDPPYLAFESLYSDAKAPVAAEVAAWAREHAEQRVALCGHRGDYDMPDWSVLDWSRGRLTYGSSETTDDECIWFSPGCVEVGVKQLGLFA